MYYQNGSNLYSFRVTGTVEPRLHIWGNHRSESITEYGLLRCRASKATYGAASVSGGISIVSESPNTSFTIVGIPFEGQLIWTPIPILGIGFKGCAIHFQC